MRAIPPACLWAYALAVPAAWASQDDARDYPAFKQGFRAALARRDYPAVADSTRLPFLFEGKPLARDGFVRIAPRLFDAKTRRCLAHREAMPEDGAMVVSCPPHAFYFRRARDGAWRLEEFNADGEQAR